MVLETPQNFIFNRGEVDLLIISGPDSDDFLNRLSTINFKNKNENSLHGAFLNGQAKLISLFTSWKLNGKNYFFVEKEMFEKTKNYLEKMHFSENLQIESEKYFCLEVRGEKLKISSEITVDAYNFGIQGFYFFSKNNFKEIGIDQKQYDQIRASFGFPKPLVDLTEDHILIEGPLDNLVDRNKGCYPGQEVIEKIYTYGRVARKIKKVILESASPKDLEILKNNLPKSLEQNGQNIGILTSVYEEGLGLATLKRLFYEKNLTFEIPLSSDRTLKASVIETSPIA